MKLRFWILLAVILIIPTYAFAGIIAPARIRLVDGDIMFRTPDDEEWLPAAINTPLNEGDALWCPDGGKAEIQLSDGTLVRLDGGSQLDMIANEDNFTHLHLASGRLYLKTARTIKADSLQIDADDTTVLPAARTRLRLDMLPGSQEDVSIFKGSAYVEGNGSRTRVRAGEHISLEEDHSELLPLNPPDSWEDWNMERDRAQARETGSDSYLPDELRNYSAELEANGSWLNDREYGMVWRPSIVVDGWAPYTSGRWIWKGDDYVWISFENWGWIPYHYGRWSFSSSFGWCWVPPARGDVYWGPGYVGWYRTGSHIGWTPLAPGEIFYGRRHYGRHSVNITGARIRTSGVKYRNQRVRGGLTVLPRSDFLRGRVVTPQPARNASVSVSVSIGSPRLQPLRETRMPVIKKSQPQIAPPRIERKDSRDLRQRFPRVTPIIDPRQKHQKASPDAAATSATPSQTPATREKRTLHPATGSAEITPKPATPPQSTPRQRDEQRQRKVVVPVAPKPAPPASDDRPQSKEQQQRQIETPEVSKPVPPPADAVPQRREQPQRAAAPSATPQRTAPQRAEKMQRESVQREFSPRKVWRVTTPETSGGIDNKGKEIRERRGR